MRVRTMGGYNQTTTSDYYTIACNGVRSASSYLGSGSSGGYTETHDVVTPNFHEMKAKGVIINNPFKQIKNTLDFGTTGIRYKTRKASCSGTTIKTYVYVGRFFGDPYSAPRTEGSDDVAQAIESARVLAGTSAMAGIREPDVSSIVELAELGKTIRMIRNPLDNFKRLLKDIARSRKFRNWLRRHPGKTLRDYVASEYLKFRFGVIPLAATLNGLMELMATPSAMISPRQTSRATVSVPVTPVQGVIDTVQDVNWRHHQDYIEEWSVTARAGVLYEHVPQFLHRAGLSPAYVPAAAWELIPFSFVADWFVNVGDYISAVTPKVGVRVLARWTTITTEQTLSYSGSYYAISDDATWANTGSNDYWYDRTTITKTRSPTVAVGLARKSWTGSVHDLLHLADGLAIINQLLSKR